MSDVYHGLLMRKPTTLSLLLAGLAWATLAQAQAPVPVGAIDATTSEWRDQVRAVGSLRSVQEVGLTTELSGRVIEINFDSGDSVDAGDVILRLDSRSETAELADLEAQLELAELELARLQRLLQRRSISEADVDAAESRRRQLEARIRGQRTLIDKKTLRAPFGGSLGLRRVNLGEVLEPGREVTTLQANDQLLVDFPLPQNALASIQPGQSLRVQVDAFANAVFEGTIQAVDARVNADTRAVTVRGQVANPDGLLRPGMFVTATVETGAARSVVTLPSSAIIYSTFGDNVYVIAGDGALTVERRAVRVGGRRGDQVMIVEGVEPGEKVVTAGQIRLRDGATVTIDEDVSPFNEAEPVGVED